jgi:hypothetical protein
VLNEVLIMQVSGKHYMHGPIKTRPTGLEALQFVLDGIDPCASQALVSRLCKTLRALHANLNINTRAIERLNMRAFERPRTSIDSSYYRTAIVIATICLLSVAKSRPAFGHGGESLTAFGQARSYNFRLPAGIRRRTRTMDEYVCATS